MLTLHNPVIGQSFRWVKEALVGTKMSGIKPWMNRLLAE